MLVVILLSVILFVAILDLLELEVFIVEVILVLVIVFVVDGGNFFESFLDVGVSDCFVSYMSLLALSSRLLLPIL